jgi:ABC-type uncharacterized transport system ATPase subunit
MQSEQDFRREEIDKADNSSVQVNDLSKRFGDLKAVEEVSFEVRDGEFFALVGPVWLRKNDASADTRRVGNSN